MATWQSCHATTHPQVPARRQAEEGDTHMTAPTTELSDSELSTLQSSKVVDARGSA